MQDSESSKICDPRDVALKAYFLGPQSENYDYLQAGLATVLENWTRWRRSLHPDEGAGISDADRGSSLFLEACHRTQTQLQSLVKSYEEEVPMHSPHFVSHMVSETSIPAILGHFVAMLHNPNNVTRDSSSAGLRIERESIEMLARMLGFESPPKVCGHFTSGGTVANFEALSRALKRQCLWILEAAKKSGDKTLLHAAHRGWDLDAAQTSSEVPSLVHVAQETQARWGVRWKPRVFVPISAHYSWEKAVSFFGLGKEALVHVPLDSEGKMDVHALRTRLEAELAEGACVVAVVSVAGSTEMGTIDPIDQVQQCLDEIRMQKGLSIWHHIDAAYGGFFACCPLEEITRDWHSSLKTGFRGANSVTVDPHKLGYVPYAAGAVLVRDPRDYHLFNPGAPYLIADTDWPGAQTLEGSRSATGPTAFWMSAQSLGLSENGYGRLLMKTLKQRKTFQQLIAEDPRFLVLPGCHTNLALFALTSTHAKARRVSDFETAVLDLMERSQSDVFGYRLSMTTFSLRKHAWLKTFLLNQDIEIDREELKALRLVFMNPFLDTRESKVRHIEELVEALKRAF